MRIGTDVSIAECRNSGYTVIEFKVKELFPNGRKAGIDKDALVNVTISNPEEWQNGRPYIYDRFEGRISPLYVYDDVMSWDAVYEMYLNNKESIDSLCGIDPVNGWTFEVDNPTEYDLLSLIDSVNSYCGLD